MSTGSPCKLLIVPLKSLMGDGLTASMFLPGFPRWCRGKESACQCKRHEFDPWVGKIPWRKGMAMNSSILAWRIPMDRGTWWTTVHGVPRSQTQVSTHTRSYLLGYPFSPHPQCPLLSPPDNLSDWSHRILSHSLAMDVTLCPVPYNQDNYGFWGSQQLMALITSPPNSPTEIRARGSELGLPLWHCQSPEGSCPSLCAATGGSGEKAKSRMREPHGKLAWCWFRNGQLSLAS